ncbi:DUF6209 family protein [Nostoc sp. FACHB-145]|uniref:DUF6209 family protein n=1 Tax=Nostoc sp. FACHB-145 TaxID=2692836 RepID=UPI001682AF7C|nr:DUF6209 family protein [Nostoc sp. FACHB-145]MBD2472755.1 hypothetical protein [Nostoc sp. FACHB-145]
MFSGFDLGKPAQITFTSDYHELVTGDLKPEVNCHISYDPLRIVPKDGSYVHGDPSKPIFIHVQFKENGSTQSKELYSPNGIISDPHIDVTGRGSMLFQEVFIPSDAEELIIWFSYLNPNTNETLYDSDYDHHFHFRWPYHDAWVRKVDVVDDSLSDRFELEVGTIPSITQVSVNWRVLNSTELLKEVTPLKNVSQTDDGTKIWKLSTVVPKRAILRFKLYYEVNGRQYKNDNASQYFLAPQPQQINVPPPPQAPVQL